MMQPAQFFQKQGTLSMQCGMHSINNLLRENVYSKNQMEAICYELSDDIINPHKHVLGGDYDANVIMIALQRKGFEVTWMDRRKGFQIPEQPNRHSMGFLVNKAMPKKLYHKALGFSARHWLCFRYSEKGTYTQCDSLEDTIGKNLTAEMLRKRMEDEVKDGAEVFWIFKQGQDKEI